MGERLGSKQGQRMYFPDLSPYPDEPEAHPEPRARRELLCVGWLDVAHPCTKGVVPEQILAAFLRECIDNPVNATRGFHRSPFIDDPPFGFPVVWKGKQHLL